MYKAVVSRVGCCIIPLLIWQVSEHDQLKQAVGDLLSELELEKAAKEEALAVVATADETIRTAHNNEQKAKVCAPCLPPSCIYGRLLMVALNNRLSQANIAKPWKQAAASMQTCCRSWRVW